MSAAPDEKWSKAQRLSVAGHVAPRLRNASEKAAQRRVARVDGDGNVIGYTTLAEVQKALLERQRIEFDVADGVRPEVVICELCGAQIKVKAGPGRPPAACPDGCRIRCPGFGTTAGRCDAQPSHRLRVKQQQSLRREGETWMCRSCAGLKRRKPDSKFQQLVSHFREMPESTVEEAASVLGIGVNIVRVYLSNWRNGRTDADPSSAPKKEKAGVKQGTVRGKYRRATEPNGKEPT